MKKKYTVLTYIINRYEVVHEILEKDPEAEYLLITDDASLTSDTWTVVCDSDLEGLSTFDKCYAIRFNCFKYAHADICMRLDGNVQIKASLKPLIDAFEAGGYDAALMPHPVRNNFEEEYAVWVAERGYPQNQADRCLKSMRDRGYDFSYKGMFQCCFSIQRRGALTDDIDRRTMEYLRELGTDGVIERIDQIPFSYIMNTEFSHIKVFPVSEQILRSYFMQYVIHNSDRKNWNIAYDYTKPDLHWMFNREVECFYLDTPLERTAVRHREKELWDDIMYYEAKMLEKQARHLGTIRRLIILSVLLALALLAALLLLS